MLTKDKNIEHQIKSMDEKLNKLHLSAEKKIKYRITASIEAFKYTLLHWFQCDTCSESTSRNLSILRAEGEENDLDFYE